MYRINKGLTVFAIPCVLLIQPALAQKTHNRNVVIVSFAGIDRWMQDVEAFAQLCGTKAGDNLTSQIEKQVDDNPGIDRNRPWGFILHGSRLTPIGFVPANDLAFLMQSFNKISPFKFRRVSEDRYSLNTPFATIHAKQIENFTYFTNDPAALKHLYGSPEEILGDLPKRYDFAVKFHPRLVPRAMRKSAAKKTSELLSSFDRSKAASIQKSVVAVVKILNDFDELRLGATFDHASNRFRVTGYGVATDDTVMSELMPELRPLKTRFSGFYDPQAQFSLNFASHLSINRNAIDFLFRKIQKSTIAKATDSANPSHHKSLRQTILEVLGVARQTIDSRYIDTAFTLDFTDEHQNIYFASHVSNVPKLRESINKLVTRLVESRKLRELRKPFHADDVNFERISILDRDGNEHKLELVLGFDKPNDTVYFAVGKAVEERLLQAVKASKQTPSARKAPIRISFSPHVLTKGLSPDVHESVSNAFDEGGQITMTLHSDNNRIHAGLELDEVIVAAVAKFLTNGTNADSISIGTN